MYRALIQVMAIASLVLACEAMMGRDYGAYQLKGAGGTSPGYGGATSTGGVPAESWGGLSGTGGRETASGGAFGGTAGITSMGGVSGLSIGGLSAGGTGGNELGCTIYPQGAFATKWRSSLGAEPSFQQKLGCPTETEQPSADGRALYQIFDRGVMYLKQGASEAFEVHGLILAEYKEHWGPDNFLRGPASVSESSGLWHQLYMLGLPTTDELPAPFNTGRYNVFEGGRILYRNVNNAAYEVHGPIEIAYGKLGFESGVMGYPVSHQLEEGCKLSASDCSTEDYNIHYSRFEFGEIKFRMLSPYDNSVTKDTWFVLKRDIGAFESELPSRLQIIAEPIGASSVTWHLSGTGFTGNAEVRFFIDRPVQGGYPIGSTTAAADGSVQHVRTFDCGELLGMETSIQGWVVIRGVDTDGTLAIKQHAPSLGCQ